jgi:hypothetical protein
VTYSVPVLANLTKGDSIERLSPSIETLNVTPILVAACIVLSLRSQYETGIRARCVTRYIHRSPIRLAYRYANKHSTGTVNRKATLPLNRYVPVNLKSINSLITHVCSLYVSCTEQCFHARSFIPGRSSSKFEKPESTASHRVAVVKTKLADYGAML